MSNRFTAWAIMLLAAVSAAHSYKLYSMENGSLFPAKQYQMNCAVVTPNGSFPSISSVVVTDPEITELGSIVAKFKTLDGKRGVAVYTPASAEACELLEM